MLMRDEEDETGMEGSRAVPAPLPSHPTGREHIEWRTHIAELGARHACEDEGAMLITSGWPLNNIT